MSSVSNNSEMSSFKKASERDRVDEVFRLGKEIESRGPGIESHKLFVAMVDESLACRTFTKSDKLLRLLLVKLDEYRGAEPFLPDIRWADKVEALINTYLLRLEV